MTIRGYNIQAGGVRINESLIPGPPYKWDGLPSDSDFGLTITTVDEAGNESVPSVLKPARTLKYTPPGADSPMSSTDTAVIDAIVAEEMALSKAPGVAVAFAGPRGKYSKAYGKISATGRALTTDDRFRIASSTKSFTSTAVLMAVQRGDFSLDDTLDQYVPNVPRGDQITLRHCMMMRSGIFDYQSSLGFLIAFMLNPTMVFTDEAILLYIQGNPSQFTPGSAYQYTNGNYVLLGMALKAVTGRPIKQIITEDILNPLGLVETRWPNDWVLPAPVGGTTNWDPSFFSAAGALASTVGDMLKWAAELRDSTLLGPEMNALRRNTFVGYPSGSGAPMPTKFGYGLGIESTGTCLGHNGSLPGWDCQIAFDTVSGALFAVAENMQTTTPYVLSAYTRIFARAADYLYPGSMAEQNYTGTTIRPAPAVIGIAGGRPVVSVNTEGAIIPGPAVVGIAGGTPTVKVVHNKLIQPAAAVIGIVGGTPGSNPIIVQPGPAVIGIAGGTPVVTVDSFTPFSEENVNRVNRPVPPEATQWRFKALGAGGGGASGRRGAADSARRGGSGGGGGALVDSGWQPVSLLGPTYSVTQGMGGPGAPDPTGTAARDGDPGSDGGDSLFTSGGITLIAGGGKGGVGGWGNTPVAVVPGGAGGDASAPPEIGATTISGTDGGRGASSTSGLNSSPNAPDNPFGSAAGGGGGGGITSSNVVMNGGKGGDTTTGSGGAGGTSASPSYGNNGPNQAPGDPGPGGGGGRGNGSAGGYGGAWGGGGGGGGGRTTGGIMYAGRSGNNGYTNLEWR